jgi:hypothetical protein
MCGRENARISLQTDNDSAAKFYPGQKKGGRKSGISQPPQVMA